LLKSRRYQDEYLNGHCSNSTRNSSKQPELIYIKSLPQSGSSIV
jgi:hypothetical protein